MQFGVAVVKRDPAIERMVEIDFGPGETEASALWGNLKALTFPLHDIVVTDHSRVNEATNAIQIRGSRVPGGGSFSRPTGEAAVVIGDKAGQNGIGRVQIASLGQTEFAGEAIL